jgi:hypothetical protein
MRRYVGYVNGEGDGLFCPGGSMANTYGMHCARHRALPNLKVKIDQINYNLKIKLVKINFLGNWIIWISSSCCTDIERRSLLGTLIIYELNIRTYLTKLNY